jgi:hypothetical protein
MVTNPSLQYYCMVTICTGNGLIPKGNWIGKFVSSFIQMSYINKKNIVLVNESLLRTRYLK